MNGPRGRARRREPGAAFLLAGSRALRADPEALRALAGGDSA
jgi:hypothetical protein